MPSIFRSILLILFVLPALCNSSLNAQEWITPYEQSEFQSSATYDEVIAWYEALAAEYDQIEIEQIGLSDIGDPIYFVTITNGEPIAENDSRVRFMINNGIHPGEPCGVDACMMMMRDLMQNPEMGEYLDNVIIGMIPLYNVGGSRNRSCCTRANQIGPDQQGFRGNARNLDLNRDFMKMDARNTFAFARGFQQFMPHVFLDTHTTNGADYQAPLTYIATLGDKLEEPAGSYLNEEFIPEMLKRSQEAELMLIPYVNKFNGPPEEGMAAFLDLPRYASGYAALFQTLGFISEAHMLKSFQTRVEATYDYLEILLAQSNDHADEIVAAVDLARKQAAQQSEVAVSWELDTASVDSVLYYGYESSYRPGAVTGAPRLFYDQEKPFTSYIPYFPTYQATNTLSVPEAYIIPQAWQEVIERLEINGVELSQLSRDTVMEVEVSYLQTTPPSGDPYEGHYYHQDVIATSSTQTLAYRAGDYVIDTRQARRTFIVHGLEPEARDSWFRWNFFDGILMQKEYFSPYLFEEIAAEILADNPELAAEFEQKKEEEPSFAENANYQLYFIYMHSDYYEPSHRRYPVARWNGGKLPLK